jgi:hypothetical protein
MQFMIRVKGLGYFNIIKVSVAFLNGCGFPFAPPPLKSWIRVTLMILLHEAFFVYPHIL